MYRNRTFPSHHQAYNRQASNCHPRSLPALKVLFGLFPLGLVLMFAGCPSQPTATRERPQPKAKTLVTAGSGLQTAVFAGGCFWCTEAVFEEVQGVTDVVSGYAGGTAEDAEYYTVSSGDTDHAEAIRITYNPQQITYEQLLELFFTVAHDPTQKDRQGPDWGRQYRSTIFYQDEKEKQVIADYIQSLDESGEFRRPIATTLEPLVEFFPAEAYHQDYVLHHPDDSYVQVNSLPKLIKLREKFPDLVRNVDLLPK